LKRLPPGGLFCFRAFFGEGEKRRRQNLPRHPLLPVPPRKTLRLKTPYSPVIGPDPFLVGLVHALKGRWIEFGNFIFLELFSTIFLINGMGKKCYRSKTVALKISKKALINLGFWSYSTPE
jgi:hypothetical protein